MVARVSEGGVQLAPKLPQPCVRRRRPLAHGRSSASAADLKMTDALQLATKAIWFEGRGSRPSLFRCCRGALRQRGANGREYTR